MEDSTRTSDVEVLIVGAGPTGLALALQLQRFGTSFRIVERLLDRAGESRALAVQARSLELLQAAGLGDELAAAGQAITRLVLHSGQHAAQVEVGGFRAPDTRYPFILLLSQSETERILDRHLAARGVVVERGVELVDFLEGDSRVECTLRHRDGRAERVRARYLAGCDGAHSSVRSKAGIPFEGGTYLQDFALGDVEADGLAQLDALHAFPGGDGIAVFFPLGSPATWRVIAMAAHAPPAASDAPTTARLSLAELQSLVDGATGGGVRLRDPQWVTRFRLHHRQTSRYRAGRIFLAGDAAHIHSPVGGQGMNTGIQDAWNLGWKLALVARGVGSEALLDSYEAERWPVGRALLQTTDRLFGWLTRSLSTRRPAAWARRAAVSWILPPLLRSERVRDRVFGFASELRIHYRESPVVEEGEPPLHEGPRAGDRLPDARIVRDGEPTYLQQELGGPRLHLLLCGDPRSWNPGRVAAAESRHGDYLRTHYLARDAGAPGVLVDERGEAFARLGVEDAGSYLVRPDGHVAYRCGGYELDGALRYLDRWFSNPPSPTR